MVSCRLSVSRVDDSTAQHIAAHHITSHHMTSPHITFIVSEPHLFFLPAQMQAHFIPSGTRLAQESLDNCFLHDANMITGQGVGQGPRTLARRARKGPVYRESQLDERSLSLLLRTERADKRQRKTSRESEREKEIRMSGGRHEKRRRDSPVYTFKRLPCVRSKRSRAYLQNARVQCDAGVLKVHTGAF